MSGMARRGFLKFLGAAPIAAPVVAQEAAAKMGLQAVIGAGGLGYNSVGGCHPVPAGSHLDWLKTRVKELADPEYVSQVRRDIRYNISRLDPDLASMRGISPSAAFSIQLDRVVKKRIEEESWSIRRQLKEATGF